jgi:phosphoribosylaminoimidazole carboxylase PurK protein
MVENVGIVGDGQLGRMTAEAALPLGYQVSVLGPTENSPAAQVGAEQIHAPLTDIDAITELAQRTDVLTWEIEHIPALHLAHLAEQGCNVEPSPLTLLMIQDKLLQKQFLQAAGIPVAPFSATLSEKSFLGGGPFVVKTRKGGYDGRGNLVVNTLDTTKITETFGDQPVYVEQAVNFEKELAVIAARDKSGNIATYPAAETVHKDNICHLVVSPAEIGRETLWAANEIAQETLKRLDGAGVFAIEMFVVNGQVLVNEIAPRVHNSGHHTIEANVTSQFEQHVRAVTGMPLGSTAMRSPAAAMINILGTRTEPLSREGLNQVLALPDTHPHFYGKSSRRARKIGHITVLGDTTAEVRQRAQEAREALSI